MAAPQWPIREENPFMKGMRYKIALLLSLLSLPAMLLVATGGPAAAVPQRSAVSARAAAVTSSSLGTFKPTFAGPAATGCRIDCHLLTGPVNTPSTAAAASGHQPGTGQGSKAVLRAHAMPSPDSRHIHLSAAERRQLAHSPSNPLPSVSCVPLGPGCNQISTSNGGATGVKGLKAVDSASLPTNPLGDIEPPDQGLCAGNGFVVETNNLRGDPGLQHRPEARIRADLARHAHGAHQAGMEQRRRSLLRV